MTEEAEAYRAPAVVRDALPAEQITPMQMLQMAVEQGADLDKLQKLMDLQERWEATQARKAFVEALAAFKADPPTVTKQHRASFPMKTGGVQEYDYVKLADIVAVIGPALSKHGLSHTWATSQGEGGISVTCALTHVMGHSESVTLSAAADQSGSKNPIQGIGSTVTYLQRYTLLAITGLAAADMDDDGQGAGMVYITAEQKEELVALLQETGFDTTKFLKWLKVDNLDVLQARFFAQAKAALEQKRGAS